MKKRLFSTTLAFLMVAALLPMGTMAATSTAVKNGETVYGNPDKDFDEVYTIHVTSDGELKISVTTDSSVYVKVKNPEGKQIAPSSYTGKAQKEDASGSYLVAHHMWNTGLVEGTFCYNVQSGAYTVTVSSCVGKLCSTTATFTVTKATATPNKSAVLVNGKKVDFDAYTINENNYFKLRDLAAILSGTQAQFEVTWDGKKNAINMTNGERYTVVGGELAAGDGTRKQANQNTSAVYLDGNKVELLAYTINQNNYFKLRDVGKLFGFYVGWDGATSTITIDTSKGYSED